MELFTKCLQKEFALFGVSDRFCGKELIPAMSKESTDNRSSLKTSQRYENFLHLSKKDCEMGSFS